MNTQLANLIKTIWNYDTIGTSDIKWNLKSNRSYVDTSCQAINNTFQYYETILGSYIKSSDVNTQLDNILIKFLNHDTKDASTIKLTLTSHTTYVDTSCQAISNTFRYYETILGSDIKLSGKSDKLTTYVTTDVDFFINSTIWNR